MSFKINQNIMENILKNVLFPKGPRNSEHIFRILMFELPDHAKETILHLSLSEDQYTPVKVGDYVTFEPPSYHSGEEFEWDILEDMGLSPGEGRVYGIVKGDTSWGNKEFNPFYSSLKIDCLYHDTEKKLRKYEHQISPLELKVVHETDIKYYNILDENVIPQPLNKEEDG